MSELRSAWHFSHKSFSVWPHSWKFKEKWFDYSLLLFIQTIRCLLSALKFLQTIFVKWRLDERYLGLTKYKQPFFQRFFFKICFIFLLQIWSNYQRPFSVGLRIPESLLTISFMRQLNLIKGIIITSQKFFKIYTFWSNLQIVSSVRTWQFAVWVFVVNFFCWVFCFAKLRILWN